MEFAEIPISVPDYFPDLIVSSYLRDQGTHKDYQDFDAVLKDMPQGREQGSLYWFYYLGVIDMLWRNQRRGILRMAVPPNCPHYHFQFNTDKNLAGVELIKAQKTRQGKWECIYVSHENYDNKSGVRQKWVEKFRKEMEPWLPGTWERLKAEVKYLSTSNSKNLKIYTNGYIGLEDLQAKISYMFGSGSLLQQGTDTLAQIAGYENATDATQKLVTQNPYVLIPLAASILFGAYLLSSRINAPQEYRRPVKT